MKKSLLVCGFVLCLLGLAAPLLKGQPRTVQAPLMTRWAREILPERVHAEYPRPQLVRWDWLNLNGHWDFALSSQHAPEPQAWASKILVPFPVESALSGVKKTVSDAQRLWYHRAFTMPSAWQGKRVLLHFGAADWETTVSVNGKRLGAHRGGYDAFSFDITEGLKPSGTNELVVSVWDPADAGAQPRGKQVRSPRGIWYTGTSGLWQTVWLEPVASAHIESVKITPDLDQSAVTLEVSVIGASGKSTVKAEVLDGAKVVQAGDANVEGNGGALKAKLTLKVPNAKPWSPDSPFLYGLRLALYAGDRSLGERGAGVSSPSPLNGERASRPPRSREAPQNRSSRRQSALISWPGRWSGLTSAATRFMGRGVSSPRARPLSDGLMRFHAQRTATPLTLALSPLRGEGNAEATSVAAADRQPDPRAVFARGGTARRGRGELRRCVAPGPGLPRL